MTMTIEQPEAFVIGSGASLTVRVVRAESTRTVVALHGEADVATTAVLSDALSRVISSCAGDVVVDLAELDFIESSTVRILATTREFLSRRGRRLTVRSPSRLALVVLEAFGLTELVEPAVKPQAA